MRGAAGAGGDASSVVESPRDKTGTPPRQSRAAAGTVQRLSSLAPSLADDGTGGPSAGDGRASATSFVITPEMMDSAVELMVKLGLYTDDTPEYIEPTQKKDVRYDGGYRVDLGKVFDLELSTDKDIAELPGVAPVHKRYFNDAKIFTIDDAMKKFLDLRAETEHGDTKESCDAFAQWLWGLGVGASWTGGVTRAVAELAGTKSSNDFKYDFSGEEMPAEHETAYRGSQSRKPLSPTPSAH